VLSDFLRVCQTLVYSQIIRNKYIGEFLLNPPEAEKSIKEVEKMKKIGVLLLIGLFLAGCGAAAKESGYWEHSTMYKSWAHLGYSWFGYKNPTIETGKKSAEQGWWGIAEEVDVSKLKSEYNPKVNPEE